MTSSTAQIEEGRIPLDKMTALTYATDDLLSDSTALTSYYREEVPEAMSFKADQQIYAGTGAGQFLGILNSNAYVTVSKEDGQAADTFIAENVMNMYARHKNPTRAEWYINQDVWPQIFKLSLAVGTGGAPLFIPPGGANSAPNGTLFGRPINVLEQCKTLGDLGDVCFGDFNEYLMIEKGGMMNQSSIHVKFLTNQTAFRWTWRVNGQPRWNNVITPYEGSDTIGHFVLLEAR
jgi:HK97 family phage major capsid protein